MVILLPNTSLITNYVARAEYLEQPGRASQPQVSCV